MKYNKAKRKNNNRALGTEYEANAAKYLENIGYKIIEKNFRTPFSEIDIIAMDGDIIVFCEVKYRKTERYGSPLEAVDRYKQFRISQGALYYYARHTLAENKAGRFDVIAITGDNKITHIKNAFEFQT